MAITPFTPSETDIVHKTQVDLIRRPVQNTIHIAQYDNQLPIIEVELFKNGFSYTLPQDSKVWLRWGTKDHVYTRTLALVSEDRKKVYFRVTYNMSYFYGNVNPILVVEDASGKSAGSSPLAVLIDRNPIQYGEGPAAPEDKILEEIRNLVNEAESDVGDVKEARDEAVAAAATATEKASEATSAASTATSAKNDAVAAKDTAVSSASTATDKASEATTAASTATSAKNDAVAAKDTAVSSASTATEKAGEASASATTATNAKNDAVAAKEAAEAAAETVEDMVLMQAIAQKYSSSKVYKTGELLTYGSKLYECIASASAGTLPTDTTYFMETTVDDKKITFGSNWFDGSGGVHYSEESDLADNIKTNEGSSVVDAVAQFDPISQAVEDGSYAKMDNMKGRSFAYNQLVQNGDFHDSSDWKAINATLTIDQNKATISAIDLTDTKCELYCYVTLIAGHKYFYTFGYYSNVVLTRLHVNGIGGSYANVIENSSKGTLNGIATAANNDSMFDIYFFKEWESTDYIIVSNCMVFDLTSMGISATTVDEAIAALRSYGIEPSVYNEYSAGKIIDSQPNKIISRGVNLWDEEWVNGYWDYDNGNYNNSSSSYISSKNKIRVNPNETYHFSIQGTTNRNGWIVYYDANGNYVTKGFANNWEQGFTKTIPSNCYYINFSIYFSTTTTYNHDITIAEGTTNPGYHAFVKDEHDLVLPPMRSAGSVADDKELVRVGTYTFTGNETIYGGTGGQFNTPDFSSLIKAPSGTSITPNIIISSGLVPTRYTAQADNANEIYVSPSGTIAFSVNGVTNNTEAKAYLAGKTINFELATPVAQDPAISLPQNIKVWNGGSLETQYEAPNTTPGLISLTYQANVKNFVVGAAKREDINWNPNNIVSQEQLQGGLAPKADTEKIESGGIIPRLAHDLTPYSDDSGAEQSNPMISQGTGTGNNTAIVTTGSFAQLREKQGNTLAWNQIVPDHARNYTNTDKTDTKTAFSLQVVAYQDTTLLAVLINTDIATTGFKAFNVQIPNGVNGNRLRIKHNGSVADIDLIYNLSAQIISGHYLNISFDLKGNNPSVTGGLIVNDLSISDITSWPADVIADLTAHPDHFSWYYNGSLAYDAGSLKNSDGVKLVCTKRNLFNPATSHDGYGINTSGNEYANANYTASDFIDVIPNRDFYARNSSGWGSEYDKNKTFIRNIDTSNTVITTSSNCRYIRLSVPISQKYNTDLSLYYTPEQGGEGYDQHYDYVEPTVVDMGSEELLAFDTKDPAGIWHHNTGEYTFSGNESWGTGNGYFYTWTSGLSDYCDNSLEVRLTNGIIAKTLSNGYLVVELYNNPQLTTESDMHQVFPSGVKCQFLLKDSAKTTSQGTPFSETIDIHDYGMMYWLDEDGNLVGIPQGAKFFYPVSYKGFTDDLYARTEGDAGELVLQSELSASEAARDAVDAQLKEALGGTLRNILANAESIDFLATTYSDLGNCTWVKYATQDNMDRFYSGSLDTLAAQNSKSVCTAFKTNAGGFVWQINNLTIGSGGGRLSVCVPKDQYDATTLKKALQGVLLAYEKASS